MDVQPRERLIDAASRLFGELGYDQTTSELIAEAANVPVTEISREFGGRRGLYLAVYRRLQEWELDFVSRYVPPGFTTADYHRLLDAYIDELEVRPCLASLWVQRRLHDAADVREIEDSYLVPQAQQVYEAVTSVVREGVDPGLALWTIAWSIQSHVLADVPGEPVDDPTRSARFRAHIHSLVDALCT